MKKLLGSLCAVMLVFGMVGSSNALTFTETGDAGESLATALSVTDNTNVITGAYFHDADMFAFLWGSGELSIYADASDPQLFLFDDSGVGVWGNDDGGSGLDARIYDSNLASGIYYLGISGYNYDPYSDSGLIFQSYPYGAQYGPTNSDPLSYWSGSTWASSYTITFSNPVNALAAVPEPATILLMGTGLLGIMVFGRKRLNKKA